MSRPVLASLPLLAAALGSACAVRLEPSDGRALSRGDPSTSVCSAEGGRWCRGSDSPARLDESCFIQVSIDSQPAPVVVSVERDRRWTGIEGDDALTIYPSRERHEVADPTEQVAAPLGGRRPVGAALGCVVGYVGFTLVIAWVYWAEGLKVILYVIAYIFSLVLIMLSVKHLYMEFNFTYPKFITALHLLFSTLGGFAVLLLRARANGEQMLVPTRWELLSRILPISVCFGGAVGLSNVGLLYVPALMAEIIGSLSPLFSVPLTLMMGLPFRLALVVPIAIVIAGAITAVQPWGVSVSVGGILCFVIATLMRAVKSVLQQEVMTGALRERFDEYTLLAWSCLTSCVMMFVWSFASERGEPWDHFARSPQRWALTGNLVVSVIIAIIVNLSHLWVTKVLGAVSSQLMAHAKAVLVLFGSMAFLGERTSTQELVGFGLVLFGTCLYGLIQQNFLCAEEKK